MVGIKRCTRCVLPDIYPSITFDEHGVCNFCLEAAKGKSKSSQKSKRELVGQGKPIK